MVAADALKQSSDNNSSNRLPDGRGSAEPPANRRIEHPGTRGAEQDILPDGTWLQLKPFFIGAYCPLLSLARGRRLNIGEAVFRHSPKVQSVIGQSGLSCSGKETEMENNKKEVGSRCEVQGCLCGAA